MKDYSKTKSLEKYVLKEKNKNLDELNKYGKKWVEVSAKNKLVYEIEWLGVPVIQTPADLILMQELIFEIKPDVLIETGIAHGGSLIYYSSLSTSDIIFYRYSFLLRVTIRYIGVAITLNSLTSPS